MDELPLIRIFHSPLLPGSPRQFSIAAGSETGGVLLQCVSPVLLTCSLFTNEPARKASGNRMPGKVFISHSSKDGDIAEAVFQHLESTGVPCWIAPRAASREGIQASIRRCSDQGGRVGPAGRYR